MDFEIHSHRFAQSILETEEEFIPLWREIQHAILSISDEMIIEHFESKTTNQKSISRTLNELLKENFTSLGWYEESFIFQDSNFQGNTWRLDFAKEFVSVEVGFNHGSVIAWNLLKPVIASELNHVKKAIQTKVGVVISATNELKKKGGFDSAIGSFEKYKDYLLPLNNQLTIPILLIGLKAPTSFYIKHKKINGRNLGNIKLYI